MERTNTTPPLAPSCLCASRFIAAIPADFCEDEQDYEAEVDDCEDDCEEDIWDAHGFRDEADYYRWRYGAM